MAQPRKLHDEYFRKAKAEGYLARSAYKLLEIQERFRVIPRGGRVLDLGCAPGSWLQVVERAAGPAALIVGVDLSEVAHRFGPRVRTVRADVNTLDASSLLSAQGGSEEAGRSEARDPAFDAVLSDMAPSTTGAGDDLLSARLCRRVLELLPRVLRRGGTLVMKILEGADYPEVLRETGALFESARGFKPKASRDVSREMYIIARGFRG